MTETRTIAAIYRYVDADDHLLHETVRYVPKAFRQRRPDPAHPGGSLWSLQGIEPVLYHLPHILATIQAGDSLYVVEGEKDADTLAALGLTATTCAMGAKAWRPSYTATLRGASVIILGDNDPDGMAHVQCVVTALAGHVAQLKVVPGLHTDAPKSDISDWIAAGGTRAAFEAAVSAIPWGTHPAPAPPKPHPAPQRPRWIERTPTYERVAAALSYINNNDRPYNEWVEIGMALHSTGEAWAEHLFDSWSQQSRKYNASKQARTWRSFRSSGKVQLGTLFYHAQQGGWVPPRQPAPLPPSPSQRPRRSWPATARMWTGVFPTINAEEVQSWH